MIQLLTKVNIIDNSGGYIGRCIKIIKPHGRDYAKIGDIILVTIKDTIKLPYTGPQGGMSKGKKGFESSKITKGSLYKALVVRTKIHNDKRVAAFDDNAVILLKTGVGTLKNKKDNGLTPLGTRIKGPISNKLAFNTTTSSFLGKKNNALNYPVPFGHSSATRPLDKTLVLPKSLSLSQSDKKKSELSRSQEKYQKILSLSKLHY